MPAVLVNYGDFAPGVGGEFEALAARAFRDSLADCYTLISNVSLKRSDSSYLECDLVVAGPDGCDVLEMKCIRPRVTVGEDHLEGTSGFRVERVFSLLALKRNVLRDRLRRAPFTRACAGLAVRFAIVVPDETEVVIEPGCGAVRVFKLSEAIRTFSAAVPAPGSAPSIAAAEFRQSWTRYRDKEDGGARHSAKFLGRFLIRRRLDSRRLDDGVRSHSYLGCDEPPCKIDVHLTEYPFDPTASADRIENYLESVSRELRVLRRIRHPHVSCAVGHFQTGSSWVQVSDWFDGAPLEHQWRGLREVSLHDKIGLCSRLADALGFCHQQGVFHRDLCGANILVSKDFDDLRLTGFELAKDLALTSTVGVAALRNRDRRLMTPEELATGHPPNPRLADIFQLGLLFYRVFRDGEWPYDDPMEFYTSGGVIERDWPSTDAVPTKLRELLLSMLSIWPSRRPDPLSRVTAVLAETSRSES